LRHILDLGESHDSINEVVRQTRAIVLEQGRNRLEGSAPTLLHDPEEVRLYLGVRAAS
jgi:ABC-type branched-subunit amino acid transport system ATPase component